MSGDSVHPGRSLNPGSLHGLGTGVLGRTGSSHPDPDWMDQNWPFSALHFCWMVAPGRRGQAETLLGAGVQPQPGPGTSGLRRLMDIARRPCQEILREPPRAGEQDPSIPHTQSLRSTRRACTHHPRGKPDP